METVAKQRKKRIVSSVALVSSFVISAFEKYTAITPEKCSSNVAGENTAKTITSTPDSSNHKL